MDLRTALLVGGAVAGPTLLRLAPRVGIPVPAYVTAGQRAALASFGVTDGTQQITPTVVAKTRQPLTAPEAAALCDALLAAAHDGAFVQDPNAAGGEAYHPMDTWVPTVTPLELTWQGLYAQDGRDLTDFGQAVAAVQKARAGLEDGFLSSAEDVAGVVDTCRVLAVNMDDQGYRITGAPEDKTLVGGLSAAGAAVVDAGKHAAAGAIGAAANALWDALNALPLPALGALALVGMVAWKHKGALL